MVTLIDMGTREGLEGDGPLPPSPKLVDPHVAIQWVATGALTEPSGPRDWYSCLENDLMMEISTAEGRRELAEEIVIGAIGSGVLRCAFVTESTQPRQPWDHAWGRLSIVDPQLFREAGYVSHGWESEGLEIAVGRDFDDEDTVSFSGFWLFWDEVQKLRPAPRNLAQNDLVEAQSGPLPALPTIPVATILPPRVTDGREYRHSTSSLPNNGRGKGRPAGKNGEPIAMFVLRVQADDVGKLDGYSQDALGAMLQEEYRRLGLKPPENTNAGRDARGVIDALMKMRAKMESRQEA